MAWISESKLYTSFFFFFFFFSFWGHTSGMWRFPGQGANWAGGGALWGLPQKSPGFPSQGRTLPSFFFFFFFSFLGPYQWHMEVPRLGVKLELQPPAYTTATATPDPSQVCNPHHSSQSCQILNPPSEPRIEPASSYGFQSGLLTAEPQRELRLCSLYFYSPVPLGYYNRI